MGQDYLTGSLTVCFGIDTVFLVHEVHGRVSEMELDEGDLIEVDNGDGFKAITVNDVLENLADRDSWKSGMSLYQGAKVRVKLNPETTKLLESNKMKRFIRYLFHSVEMGKISYDEATEILINRECDFEE